LRRWVAAIEPTSFELYEAIMKNRSETGGMSRRTVLVAAAGAVPALALMTDAAEAKMTQAAVKYQADPKDGKQCDACNFFVAPNACKQVDGDIAPTGWCLLWVKKPA
jgi:High potential iron-sulfur protein